MSTKSCNLKPLVEDLYHHFADSICSGFLVLKILFNTVLYYKTALHRSFSHIGIWICKQVKAYNMLEKRRIATVSVYKVVETCLNWKLQGGKFSWRTESKCKQLCMCSHFKYCKEISVLFGLKNTTDHIHFL